MEVRQRPRRAVDPRREQLIVDVLGLDRAQADPLHGVSASISRTSPASVSALRSVRPTSAALGPAAVVGADVDPRQHDLAVAGSQRAAHVRQHLLGREAAAPRREPAG